jgi:choline/glycine/proline betaine transport protein
MARGATKARLAVSKPVFFTSAGLLLLFLGWGSFFTDSCERVFPALLSAVTAHFGWLYVGSLAFFIVFALGIMASRYGSLRLGHDDERPEFSTLTWFAMLFSAGIGIGLLFYGVAEPVNHYLNPPTGEGLSAAAAQQAVPLTLFHWGIHPWALYAIMGLAIGYFGYRHQLPLTIRSCLQPLLGRRTSGPLGHLVDILAVFGTLFGLATSLGIGAMQINAGLHHLFGVPEGPGAQLVIIALVTGAATVSLVTGIKRGIRRLSELNMVLAACLAAFVFVAGPTLLLTKALFTNVAAYLAQAVPWSFRTTVGGDGEWHQNWTLFYWGWWFAWTPFVGTFLARISRGRTVREFLLGVILVPSLVCAVWFTIFGNTALHLEQSGQGNIAQAVAESMPTAIYVVLEQLPWSSFSSIAAILVVAVFFITSSDSASYVVDMLTSGGHPDPPVWQRVFWACAEGATAAVLLVVAGAVGLKALQAAVISVGLPVCLILLLACWSLVRAFRQEKTSSPGESR